MQLAGVLADWCCIVQSDEEPHCTVWRMWLTSCHIVPLRFFSFFKHSQTEWQLASSSLHLVAMHSSATRWSYCQVDPHWNNVSWKRADHSAKYKQSRLFTQHASAPLQCLGCNLFKYYRLRYSFKHPPILLLNQAKSVLLWSESRGYNGICIIVMTFWHVFV